jgi:sister chromatid cohesion protein DCC1
MPVTWSRILSDMARLQIKSMSQSSGYAVLCTANKTFQIRQVQTSNSVYITQPSPGGISAIASCGAVLELVPGSGNASDDLKTVLPLWDGEKAGLQLAKAALRDVVYEDLPYSVGEIDPAWKSLCAFELEGGSVRPSAMAQLAAWKAIHSSAYVDRIDLTSTVNRRQLWDLVSDEGIPEGLFNAILTRVQASLENEESSHVVLDGTFAVKYLCELILSVAPSSTLDRPTFLSSLRDSLPNEWEPLANMDVLKVCFIHQHRQSIC